MNNNIDLYDIKIYSNINIYLFYIIILLYWIINHNNKNEN